MPLFRRRRPTATCTFAFAVEPEVETLPCDGCDGCDGEGVQSRALVNRDGRLFARYWLAWYPAENEAWLDAALGPAGLPDHPERVTFGCRIGAIRGQEAPACSLVEAASVRGDHAFFGRKLNPDDARRHPWIADFWALTDWIIVNDPVAHDKLFHFQGR